METLSSVSVRYPTCFPAEMQTPSVQSQRDRSDEKLLNIIIHFLLAIHSELSMNETFERSTFALVLTLAKVTLAALKPDYFECLFISSLPTISSV